jgi:hypothetical protein
MLFVVWERLLAAHWARNRKLLGVSAIQAMKSLNE